MHPSDPFRALLLAVCAAAAFCAQAQFSDLDPDWKENQAPTPPAFSADRLIEIDVAKFSILRFGIDPHTISLTPDGVVRYVVVMRNASGSTNASYEGILCTKGEVKTDARADVNGKWTTVQNSEWTPMSDNLPSRHAYAIAKQGGCDGRTSAKREDTIRALKRQKKAFD